MSTVKKLYLPVKGWAKAIGWFLTRIVWRVKFQTLAAVPETGPVIIACNHIGLVDGLVLFGVSKRPLHLLVKAEAFKGAALPFLNGAGQIPVDPSRPRSALQAGLQVLTDGGSLGVFPQGAREGSELGAIRSGITWLALQSGASVIPAALFGTRHTGQPIGKIPGFRKRIYLEFGQPVKIDKAKPTRENLDQATSEIFNALQLTLTAAKTNTKLELPVE